MAGCTVGDDTVGSDTLLENDMLLGNAAKLPTPLATVAGWLETIGSPSRADDDGMIPNDVRDNAKYCEQRQR